MGAMRGSIHLGLEVPCTHNHGRSSKPEGIIVGTQIHQLVNVLEINHENEVKIMRME
jgi:hypothetical protein